MIIVWDNSSEGVGTRHSARIRRSRSLFIVNHHRDDDVVKEESANERAHR